MKNINATKKGLLPDEEFDSMFIQLRAEYAKAVPEKKFIVACLEKTRDNRALWNKEKMERVSYNIIERVLCLDTDISFIRRENSYLTNKMYFWIMTGLNMKYMGKYICLCIAS